MKLEMCPVVVNFNPLHREGGDDFQSRFVDQRAISIHSTARVETVSISILLLKLLISIHSTARVETLSDE